MKVVGISATLIGSKPALVVQHVLQQLQQQVPTVEVEFVDLKSFNLAFCDGRPTEAYNEDTQTLIAKVRNADAFIIATTIVHGSMPGVLKNMFELIPLAAFKGKCVLFAANGNNPLHYLAVENYMKPIATYLNMFVFPQFAFVLSSDFNEQNEIVTTKIQELNQLTEHYASFMRKLNNNVKEEVK